MTVASNSMAEAITKIVAKDVSTTILQRYNAVIATIGADEEELVAQMRLARGAALKADALPVDPVGELKNLRMARRAAFVETGAQMPYGPQ